MPTGGVSTLEMEDDVDGKQKKRVFYKNSGAVSCVAINFLLIWVELYLIMGKYQ